MAAGSAGNVGGGCVSKRGRVQSQFAGNVPSRVHAAMHRLVGTARDRSFQTAIHNFGLAEVIDKN